MRLFRCTLALLFLLCGSSHDIYAQIADVHIEYERISERVLAVWGGRIYKDQVVAIVSQKGIVVIDAGKAPTLTAAYREIIEREFGRDDFIHVINTHYHFDHTGGNQVFPEAEIIAHAKTPAMMQEWAKNRQNFVDSRRAHQMVNWKSQLNTAEYQSEQWYRLYDYLSTGRVMLDDYENSFVLTLPDITFDDEMTLDLGDITLDLYYFGDGLHTGDDILIHCREENLLFSGDLFYKEHFGFAMSPRFDGARWIHVLDKIFTEENSIKWVYDCHNGRMPGDYISLLHRYIEDVWNSLLSARENQLDLGALLETYSYENRFSYINESGLDRSHLEEVHIENLKNTWFCINGLDTAEE